MMKQNEPINISLINIKRYIRILEDLNDKQKYTNYETLCKDLLVNFGIKIKVEKIRKFYQETLENEKVN